MGRRAQTTTEETRQSILDAALELFSTHGFDGTTTRMIGERAGANVATLAYHFRDKQGLYDEVVQRIHAELAANGPALLVPGPPAEWLQRLVRQLWNFVKARKPAVQLLVRHVLQHGVAPEVVNARWREPLLSQGDLLIGAFRPEWPSAQRRLFLFQQMWTFARFAIAEDAELDGVLPREGRDDAICAWLTVQASLQLGIPLTP